MEILELIIINPFFWGLGLGILLSWFVWRDGLTKRQVMRQELKQLSKELSTQQDQLSRHMKVNQKGVEAIQQNIDTLQFENTNLKDTVAMYRQKPNPEEQRLLQVFQLATRKLNEKVPGFAPAWENAYKAADEEVDKAEEGKTRLNKRFITATSPLLLAESTIVEGEEEEEIVDETMPHVVVEPTTETEEDLNEIEEEKTE